MGRISQRSKKRAEKEFDLYFNYEQKRKEMIVDFNGVVFNIDAFSHLRTNNNETWIELFAVMKNGEEVCLYSSGHCYNSGDEIRSLYRKDMNNIKDKFSIAIGTIKI